MKEELGSSCPTFSMACLDLTDIGLSIIWKKQFGVAEKKVGVWRSDARFLYLASDKVCL